MADLWFDRLVEHTDAMLAQVDARGALVPSSDPEARTAVLVAHSLATLAFGSQLARQLGAGSLDDPNAYGRLGRAVTVLYARSLFTDESVEDGHE